MGVIQTLRNVIPFPRDRRPDHFAAAVVTAQERAGALAQCCEALRPLPYASKHAVLTELTLALDAEFNLLERCHE